MIKIYDVKINGIKNPIGYRFDDVVCSWKVEGNDKKQVNAKITLSDSIDFKNIILELDGNLSSNATKLDFKLKPYTRYYFYIEIQTENGSFKSEVAFFETAKLNKKWNADFIGTNEDRDDKHPIFFKKFKINKQIANARLYISGLGLYEVYLNNQKISDELLNPGINEYDKMIQYQTYDISKYLDTNNEIAILCGNGWYKGRLGYTGKSAFYGDRFSCISELHFEFADGKKQVIKTDRTWKYKFSNILESDIYDGEYIDDTINDKEIKNVRTLGINKSLLKERISSPILIKDRLKVDKVITNDIGETILDFGQNFAGFVSFENYLKEGNSITLDYGEILQNNHFYNDNYRTAKATFKYVSDGIKKHVRPHFTFYGFRYVRIKSNQEINVNAFIGNVVYSDLDDTITFESSDVRLNRLFLNTYWGQRSNFLDIPTDCPQRDERLGWTGDANVFSNTACFNMDCRAFYHKYLNDLRLDQLSNNGRIANFIPNIDNAGGSSVWGDAATFIPMITYNHYGDISELSHNYPLMKDWVNYVIDINKRNGVPYLWTCGFHFGDWLALDGITEQSFKGGTDDYYVASMYFYKSVSYLSEAAKILGKKKDYKYYGKYADAIKNAILNEYFTNSGRLSIDSQTGYLLSLRFNVYRDKEIIIKGLLERFKKDLFKIKCGFVGATTMLQTLAENGLDKLAYYFLFNDEYPSWFHCIDLGATTIWERWNSVLDDGSISGTGMNSLNHYSYGSVMEYVYKYIAGLKSLKPGYREVEIKPQLNHRLRELNFCYNSISGKYVSHFKINDDGTIYLHVEVPFNCRAKLYLPGKDEVLDLETGIFEKTYMPEVDFRKKYDNNSYLFEAKNDQKAIDIIHKYIPQINMEDREILINKFTDLKAMFYLGINPDNVEECIKELESLCDY